MKRLLGLFCAFLTLGCVSVQVEAGSSFDKAVQGLSRELVKRGELLGKEVVVSPHAFYDAVTGISLPLAIHLKNRLVPELTEMGVRVLPPGLDQLDCLRIKGSWIREGDELAINLEAVRFGDKGTEVLASVSGKVPLREVDPKALEADRDSWARYLIRRLEANSSGARSIAIHVRPIKVPADKVNSDLGVYLSEWLYAALSESSALRPLDQGTAMRGLSLKELRTRGIAPKARDEGEHSSLTSDLLRADGEMRGEAWLHSGKDIIEVRLRVVARSGIQVTAASGDIPIALFPPELFQPQKVSAPIQKEGISKKGLLAEISTTRGEGRPVYYKGDKISFLVRVNRPAYVYLFDLDASGAATLLYPVGRDGEPADTGLCGGRLEPGVPLVIPEDGCSVDLVVQEPFGTDTVWAVALERKLELPSSLGGDWRRSETLLERIRSQGLAGQDGYAECELTLITKP